MRRAAPLPVGFVRSVATLACVVALWPTPTTSASIQAPPLAWPVDPTALVQPIAINRGLGRVRGPRLMPPIGVDGYVMQGHALLATTTWVDAARSFNAAIRLQPQSVAAWLGLSIALDGLYDDEAADRALTTARRLAADRPEGDPTRRLVDLRGQALDVRATTGDDHATAAAAYRSALDRFLAEDKLDADRWVLRAAAAEPADAVVLLRGALARQPEHLEAHVLLSLAYERLGQFDEAIRHAEGTSRLAPLTSAVHVRHGAVLARAGRWAEARGAAMKAEIVERQRLANENVPPGEDGALARALILRGIAERRLGHQRAAPALLEQASRSRHRGPDAGREVVPWLEWLLLEARAADALTAAQVLSNRDDGLSPILGRAFQAQALTALDRADEAARAVADARQRLTALAAAWTSPRLRPFAQLAALEVDTAEAWTALGAEPGPAGDRLAAVGKAWDAPPAGGWVDALLGRERRERPRR